MTKLYHFLIIILTFGFFNLQGADYTSQGDGDFYDITTWAGLPALTLEEIQSGNHNFIIENGHTITLNDSVNVNSLTVNGTLTFGDGLGSHSMVVNGVLSISGIVNVGNHNASHKLFVYGGFANNGTVNLRNNSNQVANTYFDGTFSLTGTQEPEFNNVNFMGGAVTVGRSLNIKGNLLVASGGTFNAGSYTHTLVGSLTNMGSFNAQTSTFLFTSGLVQSITRNVTLYNATVNGGGILSLSGQLTVDNDFIVTTSSKVVTSSNQFFSNDFTVDAGSEFSANGGTVYLRGGDQDLTLSGDVAFYVMRFEGTGTKSVYGSLNCDQDIYVNGGVTLTDGAPDQSHYPEGIYVYETGTINFTGTLYFDKTTGHRIRVQNEVDLSLGSAEIIISGYTWIGDSGNPTNLQVSSNVTITDRYLVLEDESSLEGSGTAEFSIGENGTLYVRGGNNFPTGFQTYNIDPQSWVRYDANIDQTIRGGIDYGYLYLYQKNKTVDSSLNIKNNLYVYATEADAVQLNLEGFDHYLQGNLYDNYDSDRPLRRSYIRTTGGTFYLNSQNSNQSIYCRAPDHQVYKFNNLTILNPAPTEVKRVTFHGPNPQDVNDMETDMIVLGDFTATNSSTNPSLPLDIDMNTFLISNRDDGGNGSGSPGAGAFTLGDNVQLFVTGKENFARTTTSFDSRNFDLGSTVRFDGPEDQILPGITYGNIELAGGGNKEFNPFGLGVGITVLGDIERVGGSPILRVFSLFGVLTHHFHGDWLLREQDVSYPSPESITFEFVGADQDIAYTTIFPNIVFGGSGTKTIRGNLDVFGDFTLQNNVTVDASNYNIELKGNWNNSSTGHFIHANGQLTLNGDTDQEITVNDDSDTKFEVITIDKSAGTVIANSDLTVNRHFFFTQNRGHFNLNANTLNIGGYWYSRLGCDFLWSEGAMLHFNGSSEDQLIRNYNEETVYPTIKFSGSGMKRLYEKDFDINGDFIIDNAAVRAEWFDVYVAGDWVNNGGSFGHYRRTWFDGADQTIDATDFEDVRFSGTGTKFLNGHINLGGVLTIDSLATLDVSPDGGLTSYNISIEEHWENNVFTKDSSQTGQFIPRTGTVTFVGEYSNIYTGDSLAADGTGRNGKAFCNLVVNNADINYWTRLYHVSDPNDNTLKRANDLKVLNNFTLKNGIFYTYWNHVHIGGNLINNGGNFNMNERYSQSPELYLEGTGIHILNPGASHYFRRTEINNGGTYNLENDLELQGHNRTTELVVEDGKLDLNHNKLRLNSNTADLTIGSNGELEIDSLAEINIYSGNSITNNGVMKIIGTENGSAVISSISGNYDFYQNGGTIHANYYTIENTQNDGLVFNGGAIDATNNFSNGRFSGGSGSAYISLIDGGVSIPGDITLDEVVFNDGPTYNIARQVNTGAGIVTFQNSSGSLSGQDHENDVPGTVEWTYPGSRYWDGGGADNNWSTAENWVDDILPSSTDKVILDHSNVGSDYTVVVSSDITIERLSIGESGASTINLTINGGIFELTGNLTINSSGVLSQTQATDTLKVGGAWSNNGAFNANGSAVVFNPQSGTQSISGVSDPFNDLIIRGDKGENVLGTNITVNGNLFVESGILSASNRNIDLYGNWFVGGGEFKGGSGTVYFLRNDATAQTITGGRFYNVTMENASPKELDDLIYLDGTLTIEAGAFLDGGEHYVFIGNHWYNYEGPAGFSQTGSGTVVFNGRGTSDVGQYSATPTTKSTTFNHVTFEGAGTKRISNSITVNGNLNNRNGSNLWVGAGNYTATEITGTAGGTFTMNGGTMYLLGVNSFPQGFGDYSLYGGTVDYYSNDDQTIYGDANLEYYNLRVRRVNGYLDIGINGGGYTRKTANGNLFVKNQIWANDTCTVIDMNGHDLYTEGSLRLATQENGYPPQVDWNGGSFIHEGAGVTLDPDVILYNDIIKRGENWLTLSVDVTITGNVTISDESHLNMNTYKMECTELDKTFSLGSNSRVYSYIADTIGGETNYAFPTGFTTYTIDPASFYYVRGDQNQAILPNVSYGSMYLYDNATKTITLHGDLNVTGDFRNFNNDITLDDQGYNLYLGGYYNEFRSYTPTSTITFNGSSEQRIWAGDGDELTLNNVVFNGDGGISLLLEPTTFILGDIEITAGDTTTCNQNIYFTGSSFVNAGVFTHDRNSFVFDGTNQTINPGVNTFHDVRFNNGGTKTVVETGLNIDGDILIQGEFVEAPDPDPNYYEEVIVDFDTITHHIASENIIVNSNSQWLTEQANIKFDRPGTQYIPRLAAQNITFADRGYKYLEDTLEANNITIENSVVLRSSQDRDNPNDIYCSGSWINNGTFNMWDNTVYFDAANTDAKDIRTNGDIFHIFYMNQNSNTVATYTMLDNLQINEELIVGTGTTLNANGNNLQLGNNDTNDGTYPDGESHVIEAGATVDIDAGAGILFDQNDLYPELTVFGTLKVVGESGNNATLGQLAGGNRRGTNVTIESGGTVHFKYYNAEHLWFDGLTVKDGATIDPTNNFSDGIWNGMYDYTQYAHLNIADSIIDQFIYMNIQCDVSAIGDISNVTFNHPRTPVEGTHYNVYRPKDAIGTITFAGTTGGAMAGDTFELDEEQAENGGVGHVVWPPVSLVTWKGSVSSDWFNSSNWSPAQLPDETTDVVIPLITDGGENPIVLNNGAECKNIDITNGILAVESGVTDFSIAGNLTMEADAILAIADNTTITVSGDWDVANDALLAPGESTVEFTRNTGSTVINNRNASFYNLKFTGGATFYIAGSDAFVENDFSIENGTIIPNTSNYTYYIGGDFTKTGGTFSVAPDYGFMEFNGTAEQHISGGEFSRLRISNQNATVFIDDSTSVDFSNNNVVNPAFEVKDGARFEASDVLYVNGNVNIETGGTFADGGLTHIFNGRHWVGEGSYSGTGTIRFIGSPQYLHNSHFNNIVFENTPEGSNSWKYLNGTVNVTNDVSVDCYGLLLYDEHLVNTTGAGTFAILENEIGNTRVYVRGEDNYPSGFGLYTCDPDALVLYDAYIDQTIRGETGGADVQYGRLYLRNGNTKTLQGDIDVEGNLYLDQGATVLNSNDFNINLAGYWYNQNQGTFLSGTGEVIFDGSADQRMYIRSSGTNDFHKIIVNKDDPSTDVRVYYNDISIQDKLWVRNGIFYCYNDYTVTIYGDMIADNNGTFANAGNYKLANNIPGATKYIKFNGSEIRNLTIDGQATFEALDELSISNLFTLENGTFDGSGQIVTIGNGNDVANIQSLYKIGEGGELRLGNRNTFNVLSGGEIQVIGTPGAPAKVTGRDMNSRYYFSVESGATIAASNYIFENMFDAGIYVKNGATIDQTNNFSNGSFANPISGGICLRVENSQTFINDDIIDNVRFPNNPGNGTKNVAKLVSTAGILDFYAASGELAGADFEDDNYNLINWPGVNTVTWIGDAFVSSGDDRKDWNIAENWEPARVPEETDNVIIPNGSVQFPIFNIAETPGATTTVKTIENNYTLVIKGTVADGTSLVVADEFKNNNTVRFANDSAILEVKGSISNDGYFETDDNGGLLRFTGNNQSSINSEINNIWLSLYISKPSVVQMANDATFKKITVKNGELQYTANNRTLTVKSDFINEGEVNMVHSKLKLNGSGACVFKPNTSTYYNLEVASGQYSLADPQLDVNYSMSVKTGAEFNLNGNSFIFGSGSTSGGMVVDGKLKMDSDALLQLRSLADVEVKGNFEAVGTKNHEARITGDGGNRYSFVIDGGNIAAGNYVFEYLNADGLVIEPGSTIDSLSNGKFSYGAAGGRYLNFKNNIGVSDNDTLLISNMQFDEGAEFNAKRLTSTNGIVEFKDAFGLTAGHKFEDDDEDMLTGAIVWSYTKPTLFWEGDVSDVWDAPQNWNPEAVPDDESIIIIQVGLPNLPVIDANVISGTTAYAKKLTIYEGASLTIANDANLEVLEDITISGDFIVENGSASRIKVGASWSNNGTFSHGGGATVEFTSESNMDINTGGQAFYNLELNSGDGAGSSIFATQSNLNIENDLTISSGALEVSNSSHTLYVGGDFINNATFNHGNGEVVLNGSGTQNINNSNSPFYDITFTGIGAKTLTDDATIVRNIENLSTLSGGAHSIEIQGDWLGNGTFNAQTSSVIFNGTASQFIPKSVTFNNLTVNNTNATAAVRIGDPVTVTGNLALNDGVVETSTSDLIILESGASLIASGPQSYINGALRKTGSADFTFPIGSGNIYAPLGISGMSVSGTFTASYFNIPYNEASLSTELNHVSEVEHWRLTREAGAAEPLVTFHWNDGDYSGIEDIEPLVGAYYVTGTGWTNKGQSAFSGTVDAGTVTSDVPITQFGYLTIGWEYIDLTWTGTNGTAWADVANWNAAYTPSRTTNIIIPGGVTNYPLLSSNGTTYDLNVADNAVLNIGSGNILEAFGNTTIEAAGTINLNDNGQLHIKGDLIHNGAFTNGEGSSIVINGTNEQTITNIQAHNLNIAGSALKTIGGIVAIENDLTISGELDFGSSDITLGGDISLTGSIVAGTSTLELNGTALQVVSGNQVSLHDLTVNNTTGTTPQISLLSNLSVNNSLTLSNGIIAVADDKEITIENGATSTQGNATSFVDGRVRKIGISDFVFPTGDGEKWARIGISDMPSGSGDFRARYFYEDYGTSTPVSGTIDHVSFAEYWNLERPSGSATPKATLYWEDTAASAIDDPTRLLVAHYQSNTWQDMGNSHSEWDNVGNPATCPGFVTSNVNFNSFSPVTFASTSDEFNPLPVELVDFNVRAEGEDAVNVRWKTLSETSNSHFILQRSADGLMFESIDTIAGAGNSNVELRYSYTDKEPYVGVSYYRLLQVDYDGTESLSEIKSVFIDQEQQITDIVLYPNPVKDGICTIEVKGRPASQLQLMIVNSSGLVAVNEVLNIQNGKTEIGDKISTLPAGIYSVILTGHKEQWVRKLLIE